MASLSNINGLFDVHSTGAILFSTSHGTSGQILKSNGNAAPTWIPQSDIVGDYLPLACGTLTGATATASGISFTVGGTLNVSGTSTLSGGLKVIGPGSYNTIRSANDYTLGLDDSNGVSQWWFKAYTNGGFALHENTIGDKFTIASGGAATFADSITAASASIPTMSVNTNFLGSIFQYGSTFRTSSFINLLNNRNTKKYLETAYFTNGVSNQAVNIQFINASHQGFYKITLSGSYSHQDISGKLTKVIPFGYNPNGSIWRTGNNQSEITIATGGVSTNFTIGNLAWDSTNSKFIIPIYKLTNTGNAVKILVEYLGGAANNLKDVTLSSNYTQAAPSPFNVRQYRNIRDRLGIGTNTPATKLEVNGGLIKVVDSGDTAFYGGDYVRVFGTQSYGFRNTAGSSIAQISLTGNSYFNGGNVGIGITSPQDKLNLHTSSASGNIGMKITRGTETHGLRLGVNDSHAFLWTTENQDLAFATNGSQRLTIQAGGNVGINITSPKAKLDVDGDVNTTGYNSNTLEFSTFFTSGSNQVIATLSSPAAGTTCVATIEYVALYNYGGTNIAAGIIMASTRYVASVGNTYEQVDDITISLSGNDTGLEPTLFWVDGINNENKLKINVTSSAQITARVRITYHDATLTRNYAA